MHKNIRLPVRVLFVYDSPFGPKREEPATRATTVSERSRNDPSLIESDWRVFPRSMACLFWAGTYFQ